MSDGYDWFVDPSDVNWHLCRELPLRAREMGYRLVHQPCWVLLDAEDHRPVYSAPTLAYIEQFLDE